MPRGSSSPRCPAAWSGCPGHFEPAPARQGRERSGLVRLPFHNGLAALLNKEGQGVLLASASKHCHKRAATCFLRYGLFSNICISASCDWEERPKAGAPDGSCRKLPRACCPNPSEWRSSLHWHPKAIHAHLSTCHGPRGQAQSNSPL